MLSHSLIFFCFIVKFSGDMMQNKWKDKKNETKSKKLEEEVISGERSYKKEILLIKIAVISVIFFSVMASVFYKSDRLYTHFFYIPIAMSAIWRPKWTVPLGIFFSLYHILIEISIKSEVSYSIFIRAMIILLISIILNEIWKKELRYQIEINTLTYKSCHDALTKVYNRGYFQWLLGTKLKLPIVIMVIDIDGLKRVNDHFGHPAGDEQIISTAEILGKSLRFGDTLARLGGDEFGILAQSCSEEGALDIMMRVDTLVEQYNQDQSAERWLSLSIGYESDEKGTMLNETLKKADQKMYENKRRKYEVANETIQKNL